MIRIYKNLDLDLLQAMGALKLEKFDNLLSSSQIFWAHGGMGDDDNVIIAFRVNGQTLEWKVLATPDGCDAPIVIVLEAIRTIYRRLFELGNAELGVINPLWKVVQTEGSETESGMYHFVVNRGEMELPQTVASWSLEAGKTNIQYLARWCEQQKEVFQDCGDYGVMMLTGISHDWEQDVA